MGAPAARFVSWWRHSLIALATSAATWAFLQSGGPARFVNWFHLTRDNLDTMIDEKWYLWWISDCEVVEAAQEAADNNPAAMVNVVYAASENEFPGLLTSMLSLSRHLADPGGCRIHLVVLGADEDQAARLVECFRRELGPGRRAPEVRILRARPLPFNMSQFEEVWSDIWPKGAAFFTSLSFTSLYLPQYLPAEARAVWIEPDTIVQSDVARLYRTPMRTALAAALDMKVATWRAVFMDLMGDLELDRQPWWRPLDIQLDERILNSGVLVFDLDRWRAENRTGRSEEWVRRVSGVKVASLALNLEFGRHFDVLDWRWNVMGLMVTPPDHCLERAWILHWAEAKKPWSEQARELPERMQAFYRNLTGPYQPQGACSWRDEMLDSDADISL